MSQPSADELGKQLYDTGSLPKIISAFLCTGCRVICRFCKNGKTSRALNSLYPDCYGGEPIHIAHLSVTTSEIIFVELPPCAAYDGDLAACRRLVGQGADIHWKNKVCLRLGSTSCAKHWI